MQVPLPANVPIHNPVPDARRYAVWGEKNFDVEGDEAIVSAPDESRFANVPDANSTTTDVQYVTKW